MVTCSKIPLARRFRSRMLWLLLFMLFVSAPRAAQATSSVSILYLLADGSSLEISFAAEVAADLGIVNGEIITEEAARNSLPFLRRGATVNWYSYRNVIIRDKLRAIAKGLKRPGTYVKAGGVLILVQEVVYLYDLIDEYREYSDSDNLVAMLSTLSPQELALVELQMTDSAYWTGVGDYWANQGQAVADGFESAGNYVATQFDNLANSVGAQLDNTWLGNFLVGE